MKEESGESGRTALGWSGEKSSHMQAKLYVLPARLILTTRGNMVVLTTDPWILFFSVDYNQIINGDS